MTTTVAAVVIHHRRFPAVLDTIRSLIAAGVPDDHVVVVDNSEDIATSTALQAAAEGWRVHTVENRGYAAAANLGVTLLPPVDVVLVATHEVIIDAASLQALIRTVTEEPRVAAAGPSLILGDDNRVWSRGGELTERLLLPRHIRTPATFHGIKDVDWLDGACVAYRAEVLAANPFREDFFLYFEETELHSRLRERGWRVVTAPGASAYQSSGGMPAYWGSRNVVLFQWAHGTRWSRLAAPPYFALRTIAINLLGRDWSEVLSTGRGLIAGYRAVRSRDS